MPEAVKTPKKLIEVALPRDAINAAAAREKSIRHGHPSTLLVPASFQAFVLRGKGEDPLSLHKQ
jgi:hypothetical protein